MNMQVVTTASFQQAYNRLPPQRQRIVMRKIQLLAQHPHHPSLQSHRVQQCKDDLWIGYISMPLRLLYQYKKNVLYLYAVGPHCIVDKVHLRDFSSEKAEHPLRQPKKGAR